MDPDDIEPLDIDPAVACFFAGFFAAAVLI
jgi:hypothetical protein